MLLLDRAAFRLGDGAWEAEEEILRLDNRLRERLGWPLRMDALAQPWSDARRWPSGRFSSASSSAHAVPLERPRLALEDADRAVVRLNGQRVEATASGWWVDEAIRTLELPDLPAGTHALELTLPYGRAHERGVVLPAGDFGVEVHGRHTHLTRAVRDARLRRLDPPRSAFLRGQRHLSLHAPRQR